MCLNALAQASWLSAALGCAATPQLGYDPNSGTTVKEERLYTKEVGYRIECPDGTESCLRRAEAICQGHYKIVGPEHKAPPIQVYIDGRIQTLNSLNPYLVHVVCKGFDDTAIGSTQVRTDRRAVAPRP